MKKHKCYLTKLYGALYISYTYIAIAKIGVTEKAAVGLTLDRERHFQP